MLRKIGGVAAGFALAVLTIMLVEFIGRQVAPPPEGFETSSQGVLGLPAQILMAPIIAWFLGALAGSWLAIRLSGERWAGWVVSALVLISTILNFALIAHPLWAMAAGLVAPILGGWIGQRLAAAKRQEILT